VTDVSGWLPRLRSGGVIPWCTCGRSLAATSAQGLDGYRRPVQAGGRRADLRQREAGRPAGGNRIRLSGAVELRHAGPVRLVGTPRPRPPWSTSGCSARGVSRPGSRPVWGRAWSCSRAAAGSLLLRAGVGVRHGPVGSHRWRCRQPSAWWRRPLAPDSDRIRSPTPVRNSWR
jgi:hypothetical protein